MLFTLHHTLHHYTRLTHPVSDVEETLLVCEVKQEEEAHCVSEESSRQTPKPEIIQIV